MIRPLAILAAVAVFAFLLAALVAPAKQASSFENRWEPVRQMLNKIPYRRSEAACSWVVFCTVA